MALSSSYYSNCFEDKVLLYSVCSPKMRPGVSRVLQMMMLVMVLLGNPWLWDPGSGSAVLGPGGEIQIALTRRGNRRVSAGIRGG